MRTNEKWNNSHAPYHQLKQYSASAFRQNPIFLKEQNIKKISFLLQTQTNVSVNNIWNIILWVIQGLKFLRRTPMGSSLAISSDRDNM